MNFSKTDHAGKEFTSERLYSALKKDNLEGAVTENRVPSPWGQKSCVIYLYNPTSSQGTNWMGTINQCLRKQFCKAGVGLVGGQKTEALLLILGPANKSKFPHLWHDIMLSAYFPQGFILKQKWVMFVLKFYVIKD